MQVHEISSALDALKSIARVPDEPSQDTDALISEALANDHLKKIIGPVPQRRPGAILDQALGVIEEEGQKVKDIKARVGLMLEVGDVLYIRGKWDAARKRFEEVSDLCGEIGYNEGVAKALRQLGRLQRRRGGWEEARRHLEQALSLYRLLEDRQGEAEVLLNLGNIHFELGHYEEAEQVLQAGLQAGEDLDSNEMVGDITLSLGVIQLVLGFEEEALAHFTESLTRYKALNDRRRSGQAYFNLGIVYATQRHWERAEEMYERALEIARSNEDPGMVGLVYLRRGEMQAELMDVSMAQGFGQQALAMFDRVDDPLGRADVYKLYGRIAGLKNAWDEATAYLDESARLHLSCESRLGQAEVEETRGWLYERQGLVDQALRAFQHAMEQFHTLRAMGSARRVRDASMRLMDIR